VRPALESAGEGITAFILMIIELGKEYDIARRVKEEFPEEVKEVHVTYGEYDVVAKVAVKSLKDLDRVVTEIRSMPGVKTTTTLISSGPSS
jgi:DNA-binding Lrp family transcriptional regulator